jgi:hypothetical protein
MAHLCFPGHVLRTPLRGAKSVFVFMRLPSVDGLIAISSWKTGKGKDARSVKGWKIRGFIDLF